MNKSIHIFFSLLICLSLFSCGGVGGKSEKYIVQEEIPRSKIKDFEDFESYWMAFSMAVEEGDRVYVGALTNFPFQDRQGEMYGENPLSSNNLTEFLEKYDALFSKEIRKRIKIGQYKGADAGLEIIPGEPMLAEGEFLLEADSIYYPGLLFQKVEDYYRLTAIPYTP